MIINKYFEEAWQSTPKEIMLNAHNFHRTVEHRKNAVKEQLRGSKIEIDSPKPQESDLDETEADYEFNRLKLRRSQTDSFKVSAFSPEKSILLNNQRIE